MPTPYRMIQPNGGWCRLLWPEGFQHPAEVRSSLQQLASVPGCEVAPRGLDVPHTAWMLSAFEALVEACNLEPPKLPSVAAAEWVPKRELYSYQLEGVAFALAERGTLIADDMGLGKTYQAAVAAERLRRAHEGVGIILAPLMVRDNWQRELLAIGAIDSKDQFCALVSKNLDDPSFKQGAKYYFVHYDVADAWWSKLLFLKRTVAIVDEAHWIRNGRTKRAKATRTIAGSCRYRILLTGTPLDNKPQDLWLPMTVATGSRTWGSPLDFRKRYAGAQYNGYGWEDTVATNTDELQQRLQPFFLRRTAEQVGLDLPPLTRTPHYVQLDLKTQARHDAILAGISLDTLVDALKRGLADDVLPVLTQLRKLTSRAKVAATSDFVGNALDQSASVIVSCWEKEIAARLLQSIPAPMDRKFLIHGDMAQTVRAEQIQRFQATPEDAASVMVATLGSLREGVTLHRARVAVVHDLHWVFNHLLQFEKRLHRIGQSRPCQSIWMLAKRSIDEIMAPILLEKARFTQDALSIDAPMAAAKELQLKSLSTDSLVDEQLDRVLRVWREQ